MPVNTFALVIIVELLKNLSMRKVSGTKRVCCVIKNCLGTKLVEEKMNYAQLTGLCTIPLIMWKITNIICKIMHMQKAKKAKENICYSAPSIDNATSEALRYIAHTKQRQCVTHTCLRPSQP